jgi:multiple sugar transport system substrate-binding protein
MSHDRSTAKLSRREFLITGITATGAVLLTACGAGQPAPPASTTAAGGTPAAAPSAAAAPATAVPKDLPVGASGKLTVIHRTEYFEAVQTKFRDTVTEFAKAQNTPLDISTANPEAFGDFLAKMQAAVRAGVPPDLAYTSNISVQQMRFIDVVEDVSDVVAEAVKLYGDILPVTAEKNAKIEGKWWSVPYISNSGAWFARKDLFDAAGINVNDLDTYDKRRDAALKVSDPSKEIWGWGLTINKSGDGHGFIMDVIQSFGGAVVDPSGKKVVFNSPQTVEAVKWLQETYTSEKYKKMLPPGVESWTDTGNNEAWLAGKVALTQNAFTLYAQSKRDNNPIYPKTAVIRKPKTKDGKVLEAGANGWFTIFKGAKNKDLAKKLILYLIDPKVFLPMVPLGGGLFLPAYKNLWTDDMLKIDSNFPFLKDIIFNPTPYTGESYPADPSAQVDAIRAAAIQEQMLANVTSRKMTPEQAVKDAHDKMVVIFEEAGLSQK